MIIVSYGLPYIGRLSGKNLEKYLTSIDERFNFCFKTFGTIGDDWDYEVFINERVFIFKNECDAILFKLKFSEND
jgi:hypothetical protein